MKYSVLVFALLIFITANGQTEGWDPDYNADNFIGVSDLVGILSVFGSEWDSDSTIVEAIGADYIESADTTFLNSFSIGLTNSFTIESSVDILLVNTDEIRLGLAALGSQNNKSISLEATLPIIDGYKKLIVAFTAQELEYNGTSVGLEIYDESGKIEDLDLYYGTNRMLKFYCLAGTWFREHY